MVYNPNFDQPALSGTETIHTDAPRGLTTTQAIANLGAGNPGGSNRQVQYNNGGSFGGIALGNAGQVLTSTGAGAAPSMQDAVISVDVAFVAGIDPNNVPVHVMNAAGTITAIRARLELASGVAATIQPVKAASGTAISAGTALTTGTFNANGTPATNQTMTLSATPANLVLAAGDCIGLVTTGTFTASVGGMTFYIKP